MLVKLCYTIYELKLQGGKGFVFYLSHYKYVLRVECFTQLCLCFLVINRIPDIIETFAGLELQDTNIFFSTKHKHPQNCFIICVTLGSWIIF